MECTIQLQSSNYHMAIYPGVMVTMLQILARAPNRAIILMACLRKYYGIPIKTLNIKL
jgi:hypothetical protein